MTAAECEVMQCGRANGVKWNSIMTLVKSSKPLNYREVICGGEGR
jgi:hypothetical protein